MVAAVQLSLWVLAAIFEALLVAYVVWDDRRARARRRRDRERIRRRRVLLDHGALHHLNGNLTDNRPENLRVVPLRRHGRVPW